MCECARVASVMSIFRRDWKPVVDLAIGLSGCVYVVLMFCASVQAPVFAWLFVAIAGSRVLTNQVRGCMKKPNPNIDSDGSWKSQVRQPPKMLHD